MASKSELLEAIHSVADNIDGTPTVTEVCDNTEVSTHHYYDCFESWNAALREAGYDVNQNMRVSKGDVEDLLDAIRELTDGNVAPVQSKMTEEGRYSIAAYYRYFDSWTEAVKEANLEPRRVEGERISKTCEVCGDSFDVKPSLSDQILCGEDCHPEYRSENYSGKDHPNYKERVPVECIECGDTDLREQWYVQNHDFIFCTDQCESDWLRDKWMREGNPRWNGGANLTIDYYGPEWEETRLDIIRGQQAKCRACGSPESHIDGSLEVHHISPVRSFVDGDGNIDWDSAHDLSNLAALCNPCHKKWEGVPVLPNEL